MFKLLAWLVLIANISAAEDIFSKSQIRPEHLPQIRQLELLGDQCRYELPSFSMNIGNDQLTQHQIIQNPLQNLVNQVEELLTKVQQLESENNSLKQTQLDLSSQIQQLKKYQDKLQEKDIEYTSFKQDLKLPNYLEDLYKDYENMEKSKSTLKLKFKLHNKRVELFHLSKKDK